MREIEGTNATAATASGSGSAVNIVIPSDQFKPFSFMGIGVILALGISIGLGGYSLFVAQNAERESRLAEYYAISTEMYLAQHGLNPPRDPWGKSQPKKE